MQYDTTRVLVVDDDPDLLETSARFLERESSRIEVTTERRPDAVPGRLRENTLDCLVSDYQMPGMDGLALLDAVRETHPDLPFVLFTARDIEQIASDASSNGVDEYVQKRCDREQYRTLAHYIRKLGTEYRARRNSRGSNP